MTSKNEPRAETKKEEAARERDEEAAEEDAEDRTYARPRSNKQGEDEMTKAATVVDSAPETGTKATAPAPPKATTMAAVPEGEPTETAEVQWSVSQTDVDIPLKRRPWTVDVGATFLIDNEYMTVSDVSNIDNPGVTRTTPVPHQQGAIVTIWGTVRDPIGKTIAEIKHLTHGSVLVIDLVGTDGHDYLLKVSHGLLEVGGTPYWGTGKAL